MRGISIFLILALIVIISGCINNEDLDVKVNNEEPEYKISKELAGNTIEDVLGVKVNKNKAVIVYKHSENIVDEKQVLATWISIATIAFKNAPWVEEVIICADFGDNSQIKIIVPSVVLKSFWAGDISLKELIGHIEVEPLTEGPLMKYYGSFIDLCKN